MSMILSYVVFGQSNFIFMETFYKLRVGHVTLIIAPHACLWSLHGMIIYALKAALLSKNEVQFIQSSIWSDNAQIDKWKKNTDNFFSLGQYSWGWLQNIIKETWWNQDDQQHHLICVHKLLKMIYSWLWNLKQIHLLQVIDLVKPHLRHLYHVSIIHLCFDN